MRLSRFGATLTRDTRDRQFDPSRGEFLTADFAVALKQLGGNISFIELLPPIAATGVWARRTRRRAQMFERRGVLVEPRRRDPPDDLRRQRHARRGQPLQPARPRRRRPCISDVDLTLPISERFFSGGSNTLRGFGFEEAGPRAHICPGTARRPTP